MARVDRDPLGLNVCPENFRSQMLALRSVAPVVGLERIGERADGPRIVVTFDDGYVDNLTNAVPVLEELDLPATFFVTTGSTGPHTREFWWDILEHLLFDRPHEHSWVDLRLPEGRRMRVDLRSDQARRRAHVLCNRLLLFVAPSVQRELLSQLTEQLGDPGPACTEHTRLAPAQLRSLHDRGLVMIGAHTRDHPCLAALGEHDAYEQIGGSRSDLADVLGSPPAVFAYPFGAPGTVDHRHFAMAARAGYRLAFTTERRAARRDDNCFALPRVAVPDVAGDELRALAEQLCA